MGYTKYEVLEEIERQQNSIMKQIRFGIYIIILSIVFIILFRNVFFYDILTTISLFIFIIVLIYLIPSMYKKYKFYKRCKIIYDIINYYYDDDNGSGYLYKHNYGNVS